MICLTNFILSATVLATALLVHHCNAEDNIVYVRPDNGSNTTCPGQPCEPLDHYAGLTNYSNNTTFNFIPGLHTLSKNFKIANLVNIQILGMNDDRNPAAIRCTTAAGFVFENIDYFCIKNVEISACGQKIPASIYNNTENTLLMQAAVAFKNVVNLTMYSTTIRDSSGYGVAANGLYGHSTLDNCTLINNTGGNNYMGGNLALKYENCSLIHTCKHVNVTIVRSQFLNGSNSQYIDPQHYRMNSYQAKATGISLILACTNITIRLSEVRLANNKAHSFSSKGGNLFVMFGNTLQYTANQVFIEDSNIVNGTAVLGGGAYIKIIQPGDKRFDVFAQCENLISFTNVNFIANKGQKKGGALYVVYMLKESVYSRCPKGVVKIDQCYFTNNMLNTLTADSGVAINIFGYTMNGVDATSFPLNKVDITRSHFLRNELLSQNEHLVSGGATVYISNQIRETFISDCSFINNSATAISAFRSNIVFGGNVIIRNNFGLDGGGLVLCQSSYILFAPNTTVTFQQNKAVLSGGGIYAEDQCLQSEPLCFYQVYKPSTNSSHLLTKAEKISILNSIQVIMINNTAGYAGSQIFGGSMDKCATTFVKNSTLVYNKIFRESSWEWNQLDHSYVTSFPRHICFCENNIPDCNKVYNSTIYPGESIEVDLVGVGQFNHPVPATILANNPKIDQLRYTKRIKSECTRVNFTVQSKQPTETDKLTISVSSEMEYSAGSSLRSIDIRYKHCPLGTYIVNSSCFAIGLHYKYRANKPAIEKSEENVWVGYYDAINHSDFAAASGFISFNYCPLQYCNNITIINVNESYFDQDSQCYRRQGILCGACANGFSLAIASPRCVICNNRKSYIPILILATLAITALVLLFMLCCNLTITEGTINGLLFYISLFNINRQLFLNFRNSKHHDLLPSFFAWLNIDIGLDICLMDGFDAFWQTILAFFIPVFVWCVLGIIIFTASKSSRITQIVGSNPVKVLATLILISYTKFLQAEVAVFSCTVLNYPRFNSSMPRPYKSHWLADGNVLCWQGKHLVLVVIGVLFGLATVLYTLTLLFIQPLQRYSHVRGLRWVAKLKPFFDAYTSPHVIKPRYRFWTGLLLLCRMLSAAMVTITSYNNIYKHYCMVVIFTGFFILCLMHSFEGVYTKKWLYALNASFYLNITSLSLLTFYTLTKTLSDREKFQKYFTYSSLSIALATFLLITSYHVYKRLRETGLLARCMVRVRETRCWRAVVGRWNRERTGYVRLPQEDPQDREMNDDFDGERPVDEDVNWERELDEQSRGLDEDNQGSRQLEFVCDKTWGNTHTNKQTKGSSQ